MESDRYKDRSEIARTQKSFVGRFFLLLLSTVFLAGQVFAQAKSPQLLEATIAEVQSKLLSRELSCKDVVSYYKERIEAYDSASGANAISQINPQLMQRAEQLDELLRDSNTQPQLFCVPLLIKDNFDTFDMPTTGGSIALRDSFPSDDATVIARLRQEGAIVLAKTNMAEWAFSPRQTVSSTHGRTANAYDVNFVPAGSSGGTASGVAANFGLAGMGSDTGNSIRGPSSHLALVGIRPTIGLISREGVIPLIFDRDVVGPMARSVGDAVRLLNVIAGHDSADALSVPGKREPDYRQFLKDNGLKGKRLGVLSALVEQAGADPEIRRLFDQAILDLRSAGATVIESVDIADFARLNDEIPYCGRFRYDMKNYLKTLPAPPFLDVNSVLETGEIANESLDAFNFYAEYPLDVAPDDWEESCPTWPNHPLRNELLANANSLMLEQSLDALIYPSWANPPAPIDEANQLYRGDNNQRLVPDAGLPAITVPMGFWQDSLPAGIQFVGAPFSEGILIEIAKGYEYTTGHRRPPAGFGELSP
ncbi:MAG: amidase [Pseudohongiellaceae bacterium]